jgi:hypothetical protein
MWRDIILKTLLLTICAVIIFTSASTAGATIHYVCDTQATCNAGVSGWGSPSDSGTATSKASPWHTVQYALAHISSGDTLEIGNGTYSGSSNTVDAQHMPPSGSAGNYTLIQAEVVGGAQIVPNMNMSSTNGGVTLSYVRFDGIQWMNGFNLGGKTRSAPYSVTHIKVTRCGATNGQFDTELCQYILVEDCYVENSSNYPFFTTTSQNLIYRRCIARQGYYSGGSGMPNAQFMNYAAQYVEYQNCLILDVSDATWAGSGWYSMGGFYVRWTYGEITPPQNSISTHFTGCMALNVNFQYFTSYGPAAAYVIGSGSSDTQISNSVFWDMGTCFIGDHGGGPYTVNHSTFGKTNYSGPYPWNSSFLGTQTGYGTATNSIMVQNNYYAAYDGASVAYTAFYGNTVGNLYGTTDGGHNTTASNPVWSSGNTTGGLKYLPRIETGSLQSGAGNDGGDMGANILYEVGGNANGMTWDEAPTTYNTISTTPLWPWPYESIIKAFFVANATVNGSGLPSPTRGFCGGTSKDGSAQTLTKYVWEYLGNQIPSNIYGGGSGGGSTSTHQGTNMSGGVLR